MKELGFEVYCDFVENINFKKKIAVASMMDVLEHMPYPKKFSPIYIQKWRMMDV